MTGADYPVTGQLFHTGEEPVASATAGYPIGEDFAAADDHGRDYRFGMEQQQASGFGPEDVHFQEEQQQQGHEFGPAVIFPGPARLEQTPRMLTPGGRQTTLRLRHQHPPMTNLSHLRSAPRFTLGRGPRFRQSGYPHQAVRSPTAMSYAPGDPNCTSKMSRSPQFGFGSSRTGRLEAEREVRPGPGAYAHKDYIGERSLAATIGAASPPRQREGGRSLSPGGSLNDGFMTDNVPRTPKRLNGNSIVGSPGDISTADTRTPRVGRRGFGSSSSARAESVIYRSTPPPTVSAPVQKAPSGLQSIFLSIVQANGLKHLTMAGDTLACVCQVQHSDRKAKPTVVRTNAIAKCPDPVWDESFEISNWRVGEALELTIFDAGFVGARPRLGTVPKAEGHAVIPSEYFYPGGFEGELALEGVDLATVYLRIEPFQGLNQVSQPLWTPRTTPRQVMPHHYVPAPPHATSKMSTSPRYGFGNGTTGRLDVSKEVGPGPGAYAHKDVMNEKTQALLGSPRRRSPEREPQRSADFHSYSPNGPEATSKMRRGTTSRFSTSTTGRLDQQKERVPGPGCYAHKEVLGMDKTAATFRMATPRPGSANSRHLSPTFHSYEPRDPAVHKMRSGPCFGFGSSRTGRLDEDRPLTPGPGDYGGHYTQFAH